MAEEMDKRSTDSAIMLPYWDLTDAIVDGIHSVRREGKKYLPKFPAESEPDYKFRLSCSKMTNIYRDVVEALASKPFEHEISLEGDSVPEVLTSFIENVDGSGNNISVFSALTFFNGINSAIDWIFVDYPQTAPGSIKTIADEKAAGVRPFWSHVLGRNVLEARSGIVSGLEVLNYIRILEPITGHVRVFKRSPLSVVTWELWEKEESKKDEWKLIESGMLTIDVIPLVPFATGRRDGRTFRFFPVMQDAADLQQQLYIQESALEFAKIMAAHPMLAGNGVKPEKDTAGEIKKISIGPASVLYAPPDGSGSHGEWTFIEPSATSLAFLASDIASTKQDLRELGRQPLTAQSGNLTTITTAVAAGKAKSAVGAWALALKDVLENAMVITCKWLKLDYDPEVFVYHDFDNFTDGSADLDHLRKARDAGDLSLETYWHELKRRRVLSSDFDDEKERERLLEEVPGDDLTDDALPGDATSQSLETPQSSAANSNRSARA